MVVGFLAAARRLYTYRLVVVCDWSGCCASSVGKEEWWWKAIELRGKFVHIFRDKFGG